MQRMMLKTVTLSMGFQNRLWLTLQICYTFQLKPLLRVKIGTIRSHTNQLSKNTSMISLWQTSHSCKNTSAPSQLSYIFASFSVIWVFFLTTRSMNRAEECRLAQNWRTRRVYTGRSSTISSLSLPWSSTSSPSLLFSKPVKFLAMVEKSAVVNTSQA